MATFIFNLAHDAPAEDIERVHRELSNRFPQHRFIGDREKASEVEFNILMVPPSTPPGNQAKPARSTAPEEVDLVKHAFFSMIDGWG